MYVIGTAGPKVKEKRILKGIITGGVNILRLNFAHGNRYEFANFIKNARDIDSSVLIMIDLCGAKVRISNALRSIYKIYDDEEVYFCGEDEYGRIDKSLYGLKLIPLNINHRILLEKEYHQITIKDNTMIFNILESDNNLLKAKAVHGGIIRGGKGCNIKELERNDKTLSRKDRQAVLWAIDHKADIICQSFVESKDDIEMIRDFICKNNCDKLNIRIWGKIETMQGIRNVEEIGDSADGIIIGRGDLIPETSLEDTPIHEEDIINRIKAKNKDIVIATHVLESMQKGIRPTVSEVESIYNFIKAGVSGFLLAGETSVGKAPVKTVEFLNYLIEKYKN